MGQHPTLPVLHGAALPQSDGINEEMDLFAKWLLLACVLLKCILNIFISMINDYKNVNL